MCRGACLLRALFLLSLLTNCNCDNGGRKRNLTSGERAARQDFLRRQEKLRQFQDLLKEFKEDYTIPSNFKGKPKAWYLDNSCNRPLGESRCQNRSEYVGTKCMGADITRDNVASLVSDELPDFDRLSSAYGNFKGVAGCWHNFVNLMCNVYASPCNHTHQNARLIPQILCMKVYKSCSFLIEHKLWPKVLGNCSDPTVFSKDCELWDAKHDVYITDDDAVCYPPLVESRMENAWVLPGCALNCTNPFMKPQYQTTVINSVGVASVVAFFVTGFTWLAVVNREGLRHYHGMSALLLFFLGLCVCWMSSLHVATSKQPMHCNSDGSLVVFISKDLISWCSLQFVALYSCVNFGCSGLVLFCYDTLTVKRGAATMQSRWAWWMATLVLHIILLSIVFANFLVDNDGMLGVCFMGHHEPMMRIYFVYIPLAVAFVACWVLLIASILLPTRKVDDAASKETTSQLIQTCCLLLFLTVSVVVSTLIQVYENVLPHKTKKQAIVDSLICQMQPTAGLETKDCSLSYQTDVAFLLLNVFVCQFLLPAIVLNIYMWTRPDLNNSGFCIELLGKLPCAKCILKKFDRKKSKTGRGSTNLDETGLTMGLLDNSDMNNATMQTALEEGRNTNTEFSCSSDEKMTKIYGMGARKKHRWSEKQLLARGNRSRASSAGRSSSAGRNRETPNSLASTDLPPHLRLLSAAGSFSDVNTNGTLDAQHLQSLVEASYYKGIAEALSKMVISNPMAQMMQTPLLMQQMQQSAMSNNSANKSPQSAPEADANSSGTRVTAAVSSTPRPNQSVSSMGQYPNGGVATAGLPQQPMDLNQYWMHQQYMMMLSMMQQQNQHRVDGASDHGAPAHPHVRSPKDDSSTSSGATSATESARNRRRRKGGSKSASKQGAAASNQKMQTPPEEEVEVAARKSSPSISSSDFDGEKEDSSEEFIGNESDFDPEEEEFIKQNLRNSRKV